VADAVAAAVRGVDPSLVLLALATTELEAAGHAAGLPVAAEIFADRAYEADGQLLPRSRDGAVIHDPDEAARRVVAMIDAGAIIARDGTRRATRIDSICVHGDNPRSVATARRVRGALEEAGTTVAPFARR
jgi:UPF0271 protein